MRSANRAIQVFRHNIGSTATSSRAQLLTCDHIEPFTMFAHNKRLQYAVPFSKTNPRLANLTLEQFGGPHGELAAACRYSPQYLAEEDPGRTDMLIDIAGT